MDGQTTEIQFSSGTLCGYVLTGLVYLLLPAAVFLWLKRYRAARIYPVIIGAVVYFLAVRFSDLFANIIGYSASYAMKTVLAAELVCYLEETGRWLAMRWPLTDIRDTHSALCYAIGHGGLECWIRGAQQLHIYRLGQQINSAGIAHFAADKTPEHAAAVTAQFQSWADNDFVFSLLDMLNSVTNFGFHVALSLLLYRKMQETNFQKRWLLLAILLHMMLNGIVWLVSFSGNTLLIKLTGIFCGTGIILFVDRYIGGRACLDEIRYRMDTEAL